jgi:hypothetical protein
MARLFCFGLGYTARHFVNEFGGRFEAITGTVRTPGKAGAGDGPAVETMVFDGHSASRELMARLHEASAVLVSIPPSEAGDPVLLGLGGRIDAPGLAVIVYLSTVGVYGDHRGAAVDETTMPRPVSGRSQARLAAEAAWRELGGRSGVPVAILRLGGIYGPGQNALANLVAGRARRIVKPGQVFNRIHVADIAQAIGGAIERRADGIYNVVDDEPAPPQDVTVLAAKLLDREPPPEVAFADAAKTMTPMALSFYGENKRVENRKLKSELGVKLRYPTYREGIRSLYESGAFHGDAAS